MTRSFWPALRTVLISLTVVMMPVIYQQNHQEAEEQKQHYLTILAEISDLKLISLSRLLAIDQQDKDLDYRVTELEHQRWGYRK